VNVDGAREVTAHFTRVAVSGGSGVIITPTPTVTAPAGHAGTGGSGGEVAGNVYSDPSIKLLSQFGLVKAFDLQLTCGTLACGGWPSATLTFAGETIGSYAGRVSRVAAGSGAVVSMRTSKAVRKKLRAARKRHPNARPRLKISVPFGMANLEIVTKTLDLRLN
jgi:hypothetical protein